MKKRLLVSIWLGMLASVLPVTAQTTTTASFSPIEDAYLEGNTRFNNTLLKIEPNRRVTYLKFDVSGSFDTIVQSRLTMRVTGDAGSGTINFYAGSHNSWTETNITSASAPTKGALLGSMSGSFSINTVYSVDLLLSGQGAGVYTIIAEMANGGNDVWFSSTGGSSAPTLEVTFDSGPPPPITFTAYSESMDMDEEGWRFYWNAPNGWDIGVEGDLSTGEISDRSSWRPLIWSGDMWTADGDTLNNNSPSRGLRIRSSGGHTGYFGTSSELDRYGISAFTIGQAGDYQLLLGKVGTSTNGNGVWVKIFLNGSLYDELLVPVNETGDFSYIFNGLVQDDEIAVAVGANGNSSNDNYTMDYRIALLKPEYENPRVFNVADYGAVGDGVTDDGPAVLQAIDAWKNAYGPAALHFEANQTYFLGEKTSNKAYFQLDGVTQKVVEGNGSKWIFTPSNRGFQISNSDCIVIRNITVDYSPLPFTQGTIIAKDSNAGTIRVEIMDGYDDPITSRYFGVVYDPDTMRMRPTISNHIMCNSNTNLGGGVFEFYLDDAFQRNIDKMQLNDLFVYPSNDLGEEISGIRHWAQVRDNGTVAFDNVTLHTTPFFVFVSSENSKPCLYRNITISPPSGSGRLVSSYGDGFHCNQNRYGPVIEGGFFTYLMDDSINMKSSGFRVNEVVNSTTLKLSTDDHLVGDVLQFALNDSDLLGKGTVVAINGDETELDVLPDGVNANDTWVFNLSRANAGYVVQNNYFGPKRRFAGIIRSVEGKVLNNVSEYNEGWRLGNDMSGTTHEGPLAENVLFQGNTVRHTVGNDRYGLHIRTENPSTRSPRPLQNIRIIDNLFEDLPNLDINDAGNVLIQGNQFWATPFAEINRTENVTIGHSTDANGNFLQNETSLLTGSYSSSEITVDPFDYTDWAEKAGLFGDAANVNQDADGDGMVNLMEYALGGNPLLADNASVLPDWYLTDGYVYFTHEERVGDSSLSFAVEHVSDLNSGDWSSVGVEFVEESTVLNNSKNVTNRIPFDDKIFIHLVVEQP